MVLESDPEQRWSELRWALLHNLELSGVRLDPVTRSAVLAVPVARVMLEERCVAEVDLRAGRVIHAAPLSPFESRFLADNRRPAPTSGIALERPALITDLHTHFAGCVRPDALVEIGASIGAVFSADEMVALGISASRDLPLAEAPPEVRARISRGLAIPFDRQATHREMQAIYRARRPITKHPDAFVPMCRQIAEDYRAMGVSYVELSLHQIAERALLEAAHSALPAIEEEIGVTLRFLAAFGRHDDVEWMLDYLDRVEAISGSRYVAGVDVMGHETNSTHAFAPVLRDFAVRIQRARPGFVIRVHAGENAAHPENVREAARCVRGAGVTFRVGHGLYGADDEAMAALAEVGAIVEFNLDSNFALNNVQSFDPKAVPLARYLDAGIGVVLGTDGYGIYQTTMAQEAEAAAFCGLSADHLRRIRATEEAYVAGRQERERSLQPFVMPPDPDPARLRYSSAVRERKLAADEEREAAFLSRLSAVGVEVIDLTRAHALLRKKRVVSFAGAWRKSFSKVSEADRAEIDRVIPILLEAWDPDDTVLLTGGTRYGVEQRVQRAAKERGFTVLATVVRSLSAADLEEGAADYAVIVGATIYDKAAGLYRLVKAHDGWCFFIGGGAVVGDEIQTAANLHLQYLLMTGPTGASTLHAEAQPERAFRTADEALAKMAERRSSGRLRFRGVNPAVDVVVRRRDDVLLIRRRPEARAESGAWALPGGFILSDAAPGKGWTGGRETPREAAVREVREETGLDLSGSELQFVDELEGGGRDPRDTEDSWVRTTVFAVEVTEVSQPLVGGHDAEEARWWPIDALPELAFDHGRIVERWRRG